MPTNRTRKSRSPRRKIDLEYWQIEYLKAGTEPGEDDHDASWGMLAWDNSPVMPSIEECWESAKDRILSQWVKEHPGTRPFAWWEFDAPKQPDSGSGRFWEGTLPQPRRMVGGSATVKHEKLPFVPRYKYAIPDLIDIDSDDALSFESQAAYLDRHGLLTEEESNLLTPKDYEPELITCGT